MPKTQKQYVDVHRYNKVLYDQVNIFAPKGVKNKWKQYAKESGMSLSRFLIMAAEEKVMRDGL